MFEGTITFFLKTTLICSSRVSFVPADLAEPLSAEAVCSFRSPVTPECAGTRLGWGHPVEFTHEVSDLLVVGVA